MDYSKMNLQQLKAEWTNYNEIVNVIECFGTRDVERLCRIEEELEKRGVTIRIDRKLITKGGDLL